jgi:EmrB/QacA subfamily drug resistance transporter
MSRGAKTLALTSTGIALVSLDVTILNVAFGSLLREFGTDTRRELTWLFSGYNIAYAATLLTAGRLADAYGRKKAFVRGLVIFAIGSALCGIAQNPEMLIAARVIQAIGGAILSPASLALVLPEFPVERRSAAIGIWGAVGGLSAALGPVIGGALIDIANWRWVFFVNVPVCLVAAAIGVRFLRESLDETARKHVDVPGALLAVLSVGLLALAIVQSDEWGWATPTTIGILAVAAIATAAFVVACRRSTTPVLDLRLLKLPFVTASTVAGLVFSAGFFAMIFVNTQWLQAVWGYGVLKSGWATVPGPFMAALVAAPAGRAAQRFGHGKVIGLGCFIFAASMACMNIFMVKEPSFWTHFFPYNIISGFGIGLSISTFSSAATAYLPYTRFAMGSALSNTSRQVGAALGLAIVGSLLTAAVKSKDVAHGVQQGWTYVSITIFLAGIVMIALFRKPTAEQLATAAS